ncbi:MAG: hypothetical protein FD167_2578, partial [bacterium]
TLFVKLKDLPTDTSQSVALELLS